jgi:hypothetical protein
MTLQHSNHFPNNGAAMTTTATYVLKAGKFATNSFMPPQLSIYPNRVEYRGKVTPGNQESVTVGLNQITNIAVKTGWRSCSLVIDTTGGQQIAIDKVAIKDAKHAEQLLNEMRFS